LLRPLPDPALVEFSRGRIEGWGYRLPEKDILKVHELQLDKLNANRGTKRGQKAIIASLERFGAGRSVLIDKDGRVIAGNHIIENAAVAGIDEVVIVPSDGTKIIAVQRTDLSLDDAKARELAIADNRSSSLGLEWNPEILGQLAIDLDLKPFFTDIELRDVIGASFGETNDGDGCEVPVPVDPVAKPGDLYMLGDHRLLCGSATVQTDVDRLMDGELADLIWTDPPYNVSYEGKTKDKLRIDNDSMGTDVFRLFLYDSFVSMIAAAKPGASIYVAHADLEGYNFRGSFIDAGWYFAQCLVWVKQAMVLGRSDFQWRHEPILYGWKPGAAHSWYSDRKQTTVLEFDRPSRSTDHPTMKPVELIRYCLENSSNRGDIVLDLFGGSGSTLIACEETGRRSRLMELDARYVDVIVRRWEELTGKKAVLCQQDDDQNPQHSTNSKALATGGATMSRNLLEFPAAQSI